MLHTETARISVLCARIQYMHGNTMTTTGTNELSLIAHKNTYMAMTPALWQLLPTFRLHSTILRWFLGHEGQVILTALTSSEISYVTKNTCDPTLHPVHRAIRKQYGGCYYDARRGKYTAAAVHITLNVKQIQ